MKRLLLKNICLFLILSTTFIEALQAQELNIEEAGLTQGLKGYFSFDDSVICNIGEGKDLIGQLIGNASITADSKYSSGALMISPKIDSTAYVVFEEENRLPFLLNNEAELSIALWVKPNSAKGEKQTIVKTENGGLNYLFEVSKDNRFNSFISTVNPNQEKEFGNAFAKMKGEALSDETINEWYHITVTYDGDSTKIYIDGNLNHSEPVKTTGYIVVPWDNRKLFLGGQEDGQNQFEGLIDELYIFNRALNAKEVLDLKDMELPLEEYFDVFDVTFDANNGDLPIINYAEPKNNYSSSIPSTSRIGYTFKEWNTEKDGSGTSLEPLNDSLYNITEHLTYYAQWEPIIYTITYNTSNATNQETNPTIFTIEDLPIKLKEPALEGNQFRYWYKNETLIDRVYNNTIDQIGDLQLWPSWITPKEGAPAYTDYCEMLSRDINGVHYGFLAGNKMYYVAGQGQAEYDKITELETIGFTHPMFRDGRARGHGVVNGTGGIGHDLWGWEFWRRTKVAYGTLIINGIRYEHPEPTTLDWRPDKMIVRYEVGGVKITEEKFISENDVLTTIITSDRAIKIEFEGESYYDPRKIPTSDGDIATPRSQSCTSTISHNENQNTVVLLENGTAMAKTTWGEPAVLGEMMYAGLHFVFSSNHQLYNFEESKKEAGNVGYKFSLDIPAYEKVALSLGVDDDKEKATERVKEDLSNIELARDDKSEMINSILNEEIPYFRCSDNDVVEAYYFLWSLYFMYFTDLEEGWEQYPHTQTAVNNFMGLHLFDSWAFCGAGSYVADKWSWGNGNALSWKYMVPYKSDNNFMSDNFGTHWYSPETRMDFSGVVGQIWKQYDHSGDKVFLEEAYYELLRPLYIDNDSKSVGVNEAQELAMMAEQLGEMDDVAYWNTIEERETTDFLNRKWPWLMSEYETDSWKNNWHVAELRNNALSPDMTKSYIDNFVMDTDQGFISPNGINTRSADSPPNGIFRASSISCWLGIDGVFKQEASHAGITITLNNYDAMTREYGYPIAPEAWDQNDEGWGSRYYNWDIAMVLPIIEWIGGTNYSFVDSSFTYAPHLPDSWKYVEMNVPVVVKNETHWVHTKVNRVKVGKEFELRHSVSGNPLDKTQIEVYDDEREVVQKLSSVEESMTDKGNAIYRTMESSLEVTWTVGSKLDTLETLVWTKPRAREFANEIDIVVDNLIPGTDLRYTTDGSVPNEGSPIFPDTLKITETTHFTFKAFGLNTEYKPYVATYTNVALIPDSDINVSLENSLKYVLFPLENTQRSLPDFNTLKVEANGKITADDFVPTLDFEAIEKLDQEYFGMHLSGLIKMPEDKIYEFFLKADDGAILQIDGHEVIHLDGVSSKDPWFAEGSIGLEAGYHYFDIYYTQYFYRQKLTLLYKALGEREYKAVTKDMFFTPQKYALTFEENGGTEVEDIYLDSGESIIVPQNPSRIGYVFDGWFADIKMEKPYMFPENMPEVDQRIYAKWDTLFYDLTYHITSDSIETIPFSQADLPYQISNPNLKNKRFTGSYLDEGLTIAIENNLITSLEKIEVWAKYEDAFEITYHLDDQVKNPNHLRTNFTSLELPLTLEKAELYNRTFEGWYLDSNKTIVLENLQISEERDIELWAKFYDVFEVIYYMSEGEVNPNEHLTSFMESDLPIKLEEPTKEGYVFEKWYTDRNFSEELKNQEITTVEDVSLWPKFEKVYSIAYHFEEETVYSDTSLVSFQEKDLPIVLSNPTMEQKEFVGWFLDKDFTQPLEKNTIDTLQNINLWPKFIEIYTINYHLEEGVINSDNNIYSYKETDLPIILSDPSLENKTFEGWYTDENLTQLLDKNTISKADHLNLWPKFLDVYTITYHLNEEVKNLDSSFVSFQEHDLPLVLSGTLQEGKTFEGWYLDKELTIALEKNTINTASNIELWPKMLDIFSITYHLNDDVQNSNNNLNIFQHKDLPLNLENANLENHVFEGWYLDPNLTIRLERSVITEGTDIELWPKFSPLYTITYHYEEGMNKSVNEIIEFKEEDLPLKVPSPSFGKKVFKGWYTDENLINPLLENQITEGQNIDLWPKFQDIYSITFHLEEGMINNDSTLMTFQEEDLPLSIADPIYQDKQFVGWYLDQDFNQVLPNNQLVVLEDVHLWPKFLDIYTITYHIEQELWATDSVVTTFTTEDLPLEISSPNQEGMYFDGWFTNESLTARVNNNFITKAEDYQLYASFLHLNTVSFIVDDEIYHKVEELANNPIVISLPSPPEKEGFAFGGWYSTKDCIGVEIIEGSNVNQDMKVFACWKSQDIISSNEEYNWGEISIYPNPVSDDVLFISLSAEMKNKEVGLEIYDLIGNRLLSEVRIVREKDFSVDVSSLSSGYYILSISEKGEQYKKKVLKFNIR